MSDDRETGAGCLFFIFVPIFWILGFLLTCVITSIMCDIGHWILWFFGFGG